MSNYNFSPTLDGLNNVESSNVNSDTIITDYLTVNIDSSVPTKPNGTNNNSIASTAFVQDAITTGSSNLVTTNTAQTITATKTFNVLQYIPNISGKYIDLFAGQLRLFSGISGGSAIYLYVPPSGRGIIDFSSTNCDMVGQYNLTSNNMTCSFTPTSANEYTNKSYVDSVANYNNLLSSNNLWTGTNEFDNSVQNNMFVNNLDVVSFQNGAYFDNVCPYSTVPPTGSQDLVQKQYVDNNFVDKTTSQTITGSKTFNNFKANQTTGDIEMSVSSTGSIRLYVNGFPTRQFFLNFLSGAYPCIQNTSTDPIYIIAGNGTGGSASMYLQANYWSSGVGGIRLASRTEAQNGFDVIGDLKTNNLTTKSDPNSIINLNSPLLPSYNPSVLNFVDNIGSQIYKTYTSPNPLVNGNRVISTEYLPVGVYICEFYAGWNQVSNNRGISITNSSTTFDNSRACYSSQQNSSYQELNLTTVIQNTVSTTPYYLMVMCGSNTGSFSGVQYYFRATRIA